MNTSVVAWDPKGQYPDGYVVEGHTAAAVTARGAVTLPVDLDLLHINGASGWSKRSYGSGETFDFSRRRGCPIALHIGNRRSVIHWRARIMPHPRVTGLSGQLRLAADTTQQHVLASGISSIRSAAVVPESFDALGGVTIGGEVDFFSPITGLLGLCLHGQLDGGRVIWLAVSQA